MTRVVFDPATITVADPSSLPGWVSALSLWTWGDVPNSKLSDRPPTVPAYGATGAISKIVGWCGATLKRNGSVYMLGAAGGHADYLGNEVNAITLNSESPGWVELLAGTPKANVHFGAVVYPDLRRSSVHTYWSTQFDPVNNRMLIVSTGGAFGTSPPVQAPSDWEWLMSEHPDVKPPPSGTGTRTATKHWMAYNLTTNDWTHPNALAEMPYLSQSADLCCTNYATGDIYYCGVQRGSLYRYSPTADTWTNVGAWYLNGGYAGSAIDHTRGYLLYAGDPSSTRNPGIRNIANAADISPTFTGLGATVLRHNSYMGVVYDEGNDCWLVAKNTNPIDIYRVDHVSGTTFEVSLLSSVGTKPAQRPNGIHNSLQYVPELRGIVIANSYTGNMKFMRTAA